MQESELIGFVRGPLRRRFKLSVRGHRWVESKLLARPLQRLAVEHLQRNGGRPSERAQKALDWCMGRKCIAAFCVVKILEGS
jgi:hypothetical protein